MYYNHLYLSAVHIQSQFLVGRSCVLISTCSAPCSWRELKMFAKNKKVRLYGTKISQSLRKGFLIGHLEIANMYWVLTVHQALTEVLHDNTREQVLLFHPLVIDEELKLRNIPKVTQLASDGAEIWNRVYAQIFNLQLSSGWGVFGKMPISLVDL